MFHATVVDSSPDMLSMQLYGAGDGVMSDFMRRHYATVSQKFGEIGAAFVEKARHTYESIENSLLVRQARATLDAARNFFAPNSFVRYETNDEILAASPFMRRLIMAEPEIHSDWVKQRLAGWDGGFATNAFADASPEENFDYLQLTSGVLKKIQIGDKEHHGWEENIVPLVADRIKPTPLQALDILDVWELLKLANYSDFDPTQT